MKVYLSDMKYKDLEELARNKKLYVVKNYVRMATRMKYVWDEKNENIIRTEILRFPKYYYSCRTQGMEENASYKITKKEFEKLLKLIAE